MPHSQWERWWGRMTDHQPQWYKQYEADQVEMGLRTAVHFMWEEIDRAS